MKVIFFNHFNNGDIHFSRSFVKSIMPKVRQIIPDVEFWYSHRNASDLLADIDGLKYDPNLFKNAGSEYIGNRTIGNDIYFNTWYGQQSRKFLRQHEVSFDCLYELFDESCRQLWKFSLEDISKDPSVFFPAIDYSKFSISIAKTWTDSHTEKKVLVSNGRCLSGQSENFLISPIIDRIAKEHTDTTFILTNKESPTFSTNIVYSSDIIQKPGCDLNENAFISSFCDLIIGRASGAFSFAMNYYNLFERKTKFLCFSNIKIVQQNKFWLANLMSDRINYTSPIYTTNTLNEAEIFDIINGQASTI